MEVLAVVVPRLGVDRGLLPVVLALLDRDMMVVAVQGRTVVPVVVVLVRSVVAQPTMMEQTVV
jgi:hypothetical protein